MVRMPRETTPYQEADMITIANEAVWPTPAIDYAAAGLAGTSGSSSRSRIRH